MKHLNKLRVALCAAAVVVAVAFFACNKEKEPAAQQPTEVEAARKPIATFDNATGKMTYHLSTDMIQEAFERSSVSKDGNRYFLESVEILESMQVGDTIFSGLQFVILDSETESSITIWASDDFLYRINCQDSICYYFPQNIVDGNYSYKNYGKNETTTVAVKNHKIESIIPGEYASGPLFCVSCQSKHCTKGCSIRPTWTGWTCSECQGSHPDRECITTIDYGNLLTVVIAAAAIIALL